MNRNQTRKTFVFHLATIIMTKKKQCLCSILTKRIWTRMLQWSNMLLQYPRCQWTEESAIIKHWFVDCATGKAEESPLLIFSLFFLFAKLDFIAQFSILKALKKKIHFNSHMHVCWLASWEKTDNRCHLMDNCLVRTIGCYVCQSRDAKMQWGAASKYHKCETKTHKLQYL